MNKKGFTLVELIAVLALLALITMIAFPSIKNLMKNNNEKEFTTYEELMIEYAKTFPIEKYKDKGYICLNELNMKKINDSMICNGYVDIDYNQNIFTPYLLCSQNNEQLYKTDKYDSSKCE